MKRVALYLRVSTNRQDIEGYSIPLQRERLIAYCKAKGWIVAGIFVDPGHSGSTIYGRAMVGILSVFAQMERETIVERTLMGRAGRAEVGLWHGGGTDPIGYDYIDGELTVNKDEAQQVREVYELYAAGHSVTEITRKMEGYETKHGDWSHTSTVGNVLDNPLYSGTVHFDGVEASGRHTAIVSVEVDKKVKAIRKRLKRLENASDSDFLLTGVIYCGSCGARYFPNRRPNGKVVYSCHSRAKKNKKMIKDPCCKAPHLPVAELEAMVEAEVLALAADPSLLHEIVKKRATIDGDSSSNRPEEVRQLDAEINRLMDLLQYDPLSDVGDIAERIQIAHAERLKLLSSSQKIEVINYDLDSFKAILQDINFSWTISNIRGRRSFLLQLIDAVHIDGGKLIIDWSL